MSQKRIKTVRVPATTNNITKAIINFLLIHGHSASRINVQGQFDEALNEGRGGWRKSGSRNGFLDIAASIRTRFGIGLFVAIDIKRGNDKLRQDQIEFMDEVRSTGGEVFEAKDYPSFVDWYNGYLKEKYL